MIILAIVFMIVLVNLNYINSQEEMNNETDNEVVIETNTEIPDVEELPEGLEKEVINDESVNGEEIEYSNMFEKWFKGLLNVFKKMDLFIKKLDRENQTISFLIYSLIVLTIISVIIYILFYFYKMFQDNKKDVKKETKVYNKFDSYVENMKTDYKDARDRVKSYTDV